MSRPLIAAAVIISAGMLTTSPSSAGIIIHDRSATAGFNVVLTPNAATQDVHGNSGLVVNPNVDIDAGKGNPQCIIGPDIRSPNYAIGPEVRSPNCAIGPEFNQP